MKCLRLPSKSKTGAIGELLPLCDENIENMQMNDWKYFVKSVIYKEAFIQTECSYNKKTAHISEEHFQTCDYLTSLPPKQAKLVFKAKTGMLDIKALKTSMLMF